MRYDSCFTGFMLGECGNPFCWFVMRYYCGIGWRLKWDYNRGVVILMRDDHCGWLGSMRYHGGGWLGSMRNHGGGWSVSVWNYCGSAWGCWSIMVIIGVFISLISWSVIFLTMSMRPFSRYNDHSFPHIFRFFRLYYDCFLFNTCFFLNYFFARLFFYRYCCGLYSLWWWIGGRFFYERFFWEGLSGRLLLCFFTSQ